MWLVYPMYGTCMARTNIDIDDEVLGVVMQRYRLATKTEAVGLALRALADRPMTREEALAMEGARALDAVPDDLGP